MISVFGSDISDREIKNATDCMRSQWIGFGRNVDTFEKKFMAKFGLSTFAMVDSGSNALYMAVKLLDLKRGSEVIVPTFTWVSCAQAVLMAGCSPVFCDVDLDTMNATRETIERKITKRTGAVMVVHYAGLSCDMDPILSLGYPVIEDAAHAVDSTYKGNPCGTMGAVGIYSFDAVKNLTTCEGGGITVKNPLLIDRAKRMRYCGIGKSGFSSVSNGNRWWEHNVSEPFIKMLPNDISASIGIAQIDRIDELQSRRLEIWNRYQEAFEPIPQVVRPQEASHGKHSYFTYCIRVPRRDDLAKFLYDHGVYTTLRYHPLHLSPLYGQTKVYLHESETLARQALNIPLHPRMTDDEVGYVIGKIKEFYGC